MKFCCGAKRANDFKFCPICGKEIKETFPYQNCRGTWHVTTEGDCEGRSVKDLGVHTGYMDDIAKALGDKCYYTLQFKPVGKSLPEPTKAVKEVHVSLDIDSETWGMTPKERHQWFQNNFLKNRPVSVAEGTYYASVKLVF